MTRTVTAYFLGGTISMAGSAGGAVGSGGGAVVRLGGEELLSAVPQLAALDVAVQPRQFRAVPSAALSFDDVAELLEDARKSEADGIVVVQGTDTIEETAYLIDLLWELPTPVVVTGAMRHPALAGADGPANLLAAVAVAASPHAAGLGALVAFDDQVHAARFVRKTHTTSTGTFVSPNAGPLGHLVENVPVFLTRVERRPTYAIAAPVTVRVPVLAVGLDDGELLPRLVEHCDGLVVAGLGAGHVPPPLAEPLGELARQRPVVLASRTGAGSVLSSTYGAIGSEVDLLGRGLIGAGFLDPYKARVLLRVLLAADADREAIIAAFAAA